jgi:hypothetical protein
MRINRQWRICFRWTPDSPEAIEVVDYHQGGNDGRLTEIMRGTRDVSADTTIRLGRYFGTDPRFWLNLQAAMISPRRRKPTATRRSCRARRPDDERPCTAIKRGWSIAPLNPAAPPRPAA